MLAAQRSTSAVCRPWQEELPPDRHEQAQAGAPSGCAVSVFAWRRLISVDDTVQSRACSLRSDHENAMYLEIKLLCGNRFHDLYALTHSQVRAPRIQPSCAVPPPTVAHLIVVWTHCHGPCRLCWRAPSCYLHVLHSLFCRCVYRCVGNDTRCTSSYDNDIS